MADDNGSSGAVFGRLTESALLIVLRHRTTPFAQQRKRCNKDVSKGRRMPMGDRCGPGMHRWRSEENALLTGDPSPEPKRLRVTMRPQEL